METRGYWRVTCFNLNACLMHDMESAESKLPNKYLTMPHFTTSDMCAIWCRYRTSHWTVAHHQNEIELNTTTTRIIKKWTKTRYDSNQLNGGIHHIHLKSIGCLHWSTYDEFLRSTWLHWYARHFCWRRAINSTWAFGPSKSDSFGTAGVAWVQLITTRQGLKIKLN